MPKSSTSSKRKSPSKFRWHRILKRKVRKVPKRSALPVVDQHQIVELCEQHFPGTSIRQAYADLLEEVAELGTELGVSGVDAAKILTASYGKSKKANDIGGEIGDVAINLAVLAAKCGKLVEACVGKKFKILKARPVMDSRRRVAEKKRIGLRL